jgi:hypothetical protein
MWLCGRDHMYNSFENLSNYPGSIRMVELHTIVVLTACVGPSSALQRTLAFSLNFSSRRIGLILALHGLVLCYH